jgi:hypothetical protein
MLFLHVVPPASKSEVVGVATQVVSALHSRYDANLAAVTSAMLSQKASDASKMVDLQNEIVDLRLDGCLLSFSRSPVVKKATFHVTALVCPRGVPFFA